MKVFVAYLIWSQLFLLSIIILWYIERAYLFLFVAKINQFMFLDANIGAAGNCIMKALAYFALWKLRCLGILNI